jgi:hypothetical protein
MYSAFGTLALVLIDYLRPQEYLPLLRGIPVLHAATALALLGLLVDLRLGITRPVPAPHLVATMGFALWCLVTVVVRAPEQLGMRALVLSTPILLYVLLAQGLQTFRMLQVVSALILVIGVGLAAIGVDQGLSRWGCHRMATVAGHETLLHDGRPCGEEDRNICHGEGAEPGADYMCERVGLFGTQTIRGRVRFRGTMEDPNELSLVVGIVLPLALAFLDRRRSLIRVVLFALAFGTIGLCVYFTQSRGGQLVFLTVLAVYFVRRFGARAGLVTGLLLALPILLLGGREGGEASTAERTECWWTGLHLVAASPGFGVGFGQFTEHHALTAHSSFILAAAELGLPGLLIWSAVVYIAIKIPVVALRSPLAPVAHTWALALLAAMAGLVVGGMFLSYTYKTVYWIFIGLTGVLYQAIRRHDPHFTVRFGLRDLGLLAAVDAVLLVALVGYTGSKLGW